MPRPTSKPLTTTTTSSSKPFLLTVRPVNISLTDGTNIPPPPDSPPATPAKQVRGPLNSHPSTPERKIPGAYPESDVDEYDSPTKSTPPKPTHNTMSAPTTPEVQNKPKGMRRLLSLNNLRSSFSSSRTSLALPRPSTDNRPSTSRGLHRPFTPSVSSTTAPSEDGQQSLRRRRSGWFKRKSSMFSLNGAAEEDGLEDGRAGKKLKSSYSVPLLPDIKELDGGDLGWDSTKFSRGL